MKYKVGILLALLGIAVFGARGANNPHVTTLDLSIDGVDDGKEFLEPAPSTTPSGPGGFVGLGGWKKITLKAVGVNSPMKTRLNWNSGNIEVWTAPDGTRVSNPQPWDDAATMPTELWVKGVGVSATGPTKDSSGNWLTCGPEHLCLEAINNGDDPTTPGTYYDRIAFTIIKVDILELDCPHVGVGDARGLTATVDPDGRTLTWSIVGEANGCSVGPTGDVTADFAAGGANCTVRVRASDSVLLTCNDDVDLFVVGAFEDLAEAVDLRGDGEPDTYGGQWGLVEVYPLDLQDDWTAFFADSDWRPDLGTIIAPYRIGVDLKGRESLTDASQVTAETYEEAIADLNAIMAGSYVGTYVPWDGVMAHELVHLEEWTQIVTDGVLDLFSEIESLAIPFLQQDRCTVDKAKPDLREMIEPIIDSYGAEWREAWVALSEDNATQAGFDAINELIDAIEQRAIDEGW